MAFPVVASEASSQQDTNTTTHTVSMPSGVQSGDLLVVALAFDGRPGVEGTIPDNWAQLFNTADTSDNVGLRVYYKTATGSEGSTQSITTNASQCSAHHVWRITGASATVPEASVFQGPTSGTSANPPSLNPTAWDSEDTLWLALSANDSGATTVTGYPSSYSGTGQVNADSSADGVTLGYAIRNNTVSSEDPGAYTLSSSVVYATATIGIRPAVSGGGSVSGVASAAFTSTETATGIKTVSGSIASLVTNTFSVVGSKSVNGSIASLVSSSFSAVGTKTVLASIVAPLSGSSSIVGTKTVNGLAVNSALSSFSVVGNKTVFGSAQRNLVNSVTAVGSKVVSGASQAVLSDASQVSGIVSKSGSATSSSLLASTVTGTKTVLGFAGFTSPLSPVAIGSSMGPNSGLANVNLVSTRVATGLKSVSGVALSAHNGGSTVLGTRVVSATALSIIDSTFSATSYGQADEDVQHPVDSGGGGQAPVISLVPGVNSSQSSAVSLAITVSVTSSIHSRIGLISAELRRKSYRTSSINLSTVFNGSVRAAGSMVVPLTTRKINFSEKDETEFLALFISAMISNESNSGN